MRGMLPGFTASSARMPTMPSASPSTPPSSDSTTLSVSSCRTMRPRPAPIAARIAISRLRTVARTSSRLATFAQAMSRTKVDRAQQHPQRRPHVADDDLLQRLRRRSRPARPARSETPRGTPSAACCSCAVAGGERDARLQAAGGDEEVPLHRAVRIDLKRQPDVRRAGRRLDGLGVERVPARRSLRAARRSSDSVRPTTARIAAEAPLPEAFAQDARRGRRSAGLPPAVNVRPATIGAPNSRKKSALTWADATCSGSAPGEVDDAEPVRRDVLQGAGLPAPVVELGRRRARSRSLRRGVEKASPDGPGPGRAAAAGGRC